MGLTANACIVNKLPRVLVYLPRYSQAVCNALTCNRSGRLFVYKSGCTVFCSDSSPASEVTPTGRQTLMVRMVHKIGGIT